MQTPPLYAPWRLEYLRSLDKSGPDECFLCRAAAAADPAARRQSLLLWSTDLSIAVINRYPYANGHLLIAPREHKPDLEELSEPQQLDLSRQTTLAVRILKQAVSAQGFNIGINLGRVAGAGLPGHVHQHIVPRWGGDINFINVVGETHIVPQALSQLYDQLLRTWTELTSSGA
jgi:ATP adenylyltransferase